MRRSRITYAAVLVLSAGLASAQTAETAEPKPTVSITATVKAREIVFREAGEVTHTFLGSPLNRNVWRAERINLPKPVEEKVLYRDAGVVLTITSTLPNIEQILDEALGPKSRLEKKP